MLFENIISIGNVIHRDYNKFFNIINKRKAISMILSAGIDYLVHMSIEFKSIKVFYILIL
jgi:hypothetical protein